MRNPARANQVLLTVSGVIDPSIRDRIARGERPRADYLELAAGLGADLLDYDGARDAGGMIGRVLELVAGPNMLLAWACWRQRARYRVIFTDGEQIGIPLALFLKLLGRGANAVRHAMIVHTLDAPKKGVFFDRLGIQAQIDRFFVYASWQKAFIERKWGVAPSRVVLTPFMVDDAFFAPARVTAVPTSRPQLCAVGLERRDYPTLIEAVRDLPVDVVIAAASPWSKQSDTTAQAAIPDNVRVQRFTQFELRQLYADSAFLVMPLLNVTFQAGVTAILEAMAMERAVICSLTPGQTDVIEDGVHGTYVPPGDAAALRAAIAQLIARPDLASGMGQAGRRLVETRMNLDHYVDGLRTHLADLLPAPSPTA